VEKIIANYQANGVENVYFTLVEELKNWKNIRRKLRAKRAIAARWKKYRQKK
jgi:hypothetical protein